MELPWVRTIPTPCVAPKTDRLHPASHWSGGDKWLTLVPKTGGKLVTKFFSFSPDAWTSLPELGTPPYSFASALTEARGLVSAGKTGPDGAWNITLIHPAGSKDLLLTLRTTGKAIAGSIVDDQLEITDPITTGTVEGNHLTRAG